MEKEASEWASISYYLYSGISDQLLLMKNHPAMAPEGHVKDIQKAIDIYSEHCIVGSDHLRAILSELIQTVEERRLEDG